MLMLQYKPPLVISWVLPLIRHRTGISSAARSIWDTTLLTLVVPPIYRPRTPPLPD